MASVAVVSGFIDIPNHPRGSADYRALGEQLFKAIEPRQALVFDNEKLAVDSTWLAQWLKGQPNVTHSVADNQEKNTKDYHCVQHEKLAWIAKAAEAAPEFDFYVWIDYGILHVPGVTAEVINRFLDMVDSYGASVRMPGCWPKKQDVPHDHPCWRFCGGLIVVPRPLVKPFTRLGMSTAARQIMATKNVEWEVNTLARLELLDQVPITWYQADHNQEMFTGVK